MAVDTLSLAGKVAIVTGSARENGIGAAIAVALARNGAAVTISYTSDSSAPRAANVAKKIIDAGGKAAVIKATIENPEEDEYLVKETLKAFGTDHIDILVNNAGWGYPHSTMDVPAKDVEAMFRINTFGMIFLTKAVVPHMPKGGRIINISSVASKLGMDVLPIYGATKAAMDSLTYTWAKEFGISKGITVNSVAPGPVLTDLVSEDEVETSYKDLLDKTRAERRIAKPEDIADIVLLIANERGRWITGQFISASGGITGQ